MFDLTKHDKTSGETKEQKEVYESGDYKSVPLPIPWSSTYPSFQELLQLGQPPFREEDQRHVPQVL